MKGKISLGLVVMLVVLALSSVFAADTFNGQRIFNITAKYDGKILTNEEEIKVYPSSPRTITITTDSKFVDESLVIGYKWDVDAWTDTKGVNEVTFTIPNFEVGTNHIVTMEAYINHNKDLPEGDPNRYVGNSNKMYVVFEFVENQEQSAETIVVTLKDAGNQVAATTVVNNGIFNHFEYKWDGNGANTQTASTFTFPKEVGKHTLEVVGVTKNGVKSTPVSIVVETVEEEVTPVEPIEDDLIIEPWMKENKDMETLAVSLRNASDAFDKANKNMYALDEEVIYYVDYKNGGKTINQDVKLVLELPLQFKVVDSFGGTVDKDKKTITWDFEGLEKGQTGTKVVKVKYTSLGKSSYKSQTVYPQARIYLANQKSPKDVSTVINLIFKGEKVTIADEHYPYMIGDKGTNTFRPDDGITRAEGALVLARIFGINYSGTTVVGNEFSDLEETYMDARKAIVASSKLGLISGFPDGSYKPNEKMTKAQFMRIIASYVEVKAQEDEINGLEIKDSDTAIKVYKNSTNLYIVGQSATENHWAIPYVTLLARINMTPVSEKNKNLGLDDEITRAEVAQLVNYFLFRAPQEEGKVKFSDVSKKHKLYGDILEATMDPHTYTLTLEGTEIAEDED